MGIKYPEKPTAREARMAREAELRKRRAAELRRISFIEMRRKSKSPKRTPEEQAAVLRMARTLQVRLLKEGTKQAMPVKGIGKQQN